jgi:hypothetical protein
LLVFLAQFCRLESFNEILDSNCSASDLAEQIIKGVAAQLFQQQSDMTAFNYFFKRSVMFSDLSFADLPT